MKRVGEKYLASGIDLFLQTGRASRLHAFHFLHEVHVRTPFTAHPILEPPRSHLYPHPARGGALRPVAPIGRFAESIVVTTCQRANAIVRVLLASEIDFSDTRIPSLSQNYVKKRVENCQDDELTSIRGSRRRTSPWRPIVCYT